MSITRNIVLFLLMIAASAGAFALRPTEKIADHGPEINLQTMIPRSFGEWHEEDRSSAFVVDPTQSELIRKIYGQTLSRIYVDRHGYRIMLSIAYGSDQSDAMQVHKPETCYPAQGFLLEARGDDLLRIGNADIPVVRIKTSLDSRHEPVTYWTTIGNRAVRGSIHKKFVEMYYGLTGKIPDGMLIRVSSIDSDTPQAFRSQDRFITELIDAVPITTRIRLAGIPLSDSEQIP